MSDDAGVEMGDNAHRSELMESYRNDYKKNRTKQGENTDQIIPVPVKRGMKSTLPKTCPHKSPLLEKASSDVVKAAYDGDLKKVMELHSAGYSLLSINDQGETALHCAAEQGHREIVKYLLASAPPTILDMIDNDRGQTALHRASLSKQRTISCMLVAAGASLTLPDRGRKTARQLAEQVGDTDLAIYLESKSRSFSE